MSVLNRNKIISFEMKQRRKRSIQMRTATHCDEADRRSGVCGADHAAPTAAAPGDEAIRGALKAVEAD